MAKARNYRREYDNYHSSATQRRNRSTRNKARRKLGLAVGNKKEVDHIKPLSRGGSNAAHNLRAVSRTTNRQKGNR